MSERGKYIVIEGHDGTGKSEQVARLRKHLGAMGVNICDFVVEEPDGATKDDGTVLVPIASELRKIIKNGSLARDPWTNISLFAAARRENWLQAIEPALARGEWVLTARSWLSTVAYQGYGQSMPLDEIARITAQDVGETYMNPDIALILDVQDTATRQRRIAERGDLEVPDTFESLPEDFQTRVKDGYVTYAKENSIPLIDASGTKDEVEALIWVHIEKELL